MWASDFFGGVVGVGVRKEQNGREDVFICVNYAA